MTSVQREKDVRKRTMIRIGVGEEGRREQLT